MSSRQKLETQLTENNIVREVTWLIILYTEKISRHVFFELLQNNLLTFQELDLLESSSTVYKLIGPVLVKQDLDEAKATVGKRLEYITGEL